MAEKIEKIIFVFFLLLFPLGEIGRLSLGNNIAVTVSDIVLGMLIVFWFIHHLINKKSFKRTLTKPILFFVITCILSLLFNIKNLMPNEFFVSVLYFLRWVLYAGLYFAVSSFDSLFKKKITSVLGFVGGLFVLEGYVQYFFYPNLRNLYYAGWDEHLYRMFSSFLDPNFAGAFFVLYFMVIIGLIFQTRFWSSQNDRKRVFFLCCVAVLTVGAIFLTYSRSAYIMLLVSGLLFVFMMIRSRGTRTVFISLGFLTFFITTVSLSKLPQSEGTNLLRIVSTQARIGSAQNAVTIFADNPLFGVGFNAYRYAQYRYGFLEQNPKKDNHAGAGTDNSFLFVLATTGIVGFAAYLYLLFSITKNAYKQNVFFFCSMVGLCIDALFINSLFYPFLLIWVWILAGFTENM